LTFLIRETCVEAQGEQEHTCSETQLGVLTCCVQEEPIPGISEYLRKSEFALLGDLELKEIGICSKLRLLESSSNFMVGTFIISSSIWESERAKWN
jgi:hypothetical protein